MHTPSPSLSLKLSGLALALLVMLAGCMAPEEASAVNALNGDRAVYGRSSLAADLALQAKAQYFASHLATTSGGLCVAGTLYHSTLTDMAPAGWQKLGENVACRTTKGDIAGTVPLLEAQLMASAGHKANIIDPAYTHTGIGLVAVPWTGHPGYLVVFEAQEFARL